MLNIVSCSYVGDYKLKLLFDNESYGIADLRGLPETRTVFESLQDKSVFKDFKLEHGITTWLNGKLDIAPEYLFFLANKDKLELQSLFIELGYK